MQVKNKKQYTILVSGASGIVGYGILKSLRQLDCKLIGTTIYEESPANCFADIVIKAPMTNESVYFLWLMSIIDKYQVDMIIPAIDVDVYAWNQNRSEIERKGVVVLLNNSSLIEWCKDKWFFYEKLKQEKVQFCIQSSIVPDIDQFEMPFILKPRCGYGSRGIVKVESRENYKLYESKIGDELFMQEYVGSDDEEYTVSGFFDKDSSMKACITMKRKLSKEGYTEIAEVIYLEDILEIITELAVIFKPVGPTNFQFRKKNNDWKLLEINPRISSSTSIRKAFGYNEAKMCVEYFLEGKEIEQPEIKMGKAIRYVEDFILYDSNNI